MKFLTLKTALADILATKNTFKQSAVTFKVFVLWLRNQRYYTCDVIGIKITYRDLLYYKGIRAKTSHKYKLHKNKHKNHVNIPLETYLGPSLLYPVILNVG